MCGVKKKGKIRNEHVRGSEKVAPMANKITDKKAGMDTSREGTNATC